MTILEIRSPGPHEGAEGGLRRAVDTEGGSTFDSCDGARKDDRATILQRRQGFLHGEQRSFDIDIEEFVEMLFSDFVERRKFRNAGIGEHDVKFPLCFDGLIEAIEVGQFGNVSLNASDVAADRLYRLVQLFLTAARDQDVGTFFYEELCRSQPYPSCATSNDCHFSVQLLISGHRMWLSSLSALSCSLARWTEGNRGRAVRKCASTG